MTPLDHALAYARLGWRVAPIAPGTKWPRIDQWQHHASKQPPHINRWWAERPDDGVSIVTGDASGIFVVDVDPRHGGDDTLADLEHEHGRLPDTVESITGGGGRHLIFAMPPGVTITNDAGKRLGPGLDVRGEGGQIVAPPTIHPETGVRYEWEASSDPLEGVTPADAPAWLVELLTVQAPVVTPRRTAAPTGHRLDLRPGDRYELETEWADLLTRDGWTLHSARRGRDGDYELWTRPGKDPSDGASASLYYQGSGVLKVFTSSVPQLDPDATYTRFGYTAAMHHGGNHQAFGRELAQQYRPQLLPTDPPTGGGQNDARASEPPPRPAIVHNGRQHDAVVADAIAALEAANQPPQMFVRSGALARLRSDEEHRPLIETLRAEHGRLALADAAHWYRSTKDGLTATAPPLDVATSVLARGDWPLPPLAGVVELPVLRPDGTWHAAHGYDPVTRLFHWHPGRPYPPVPAAPTRAEVTAAVTLVDEALADFPWDTTADRANAWGLLLTPLVRPLVGQVPMALVDAPEPGTGKGLLVSVVATIALGRSAGLATLPTTEEEMDKVLTTMLMAGQTMVIFDNVEGTIRSGKLAAALTADVWSGRILGRSELATVAQRATWIATGNNIDVGGDLARRCFRIRLDARQAQPWKRTGFRHPDLEAWVRSQRTELLHALATIVAAWWTAGRPQADALPAMGSYSSWVRTIGGILEVAGVGGFLANLDAFHEDADADAREWEGFLTAWHDAIGEEAKTTQQLVDRIRDMMVGNSLRTALPSSLAGYVDTANFAQRLGKQLRARAGRHYGADGIHISELPRDRRRIAIWCATTRSVRLFDDDSRAANGDLPGAMDSSAGVAGVMSATPCEKSSVDKYLYGEGAAITPATPALPRADHDDIGLF